MTISRYMERDPATPCLRCGKALSEHFEGRSCPLRRSIKPGDTFVPPPRLDEPVEPSAWRTLVKDPDAE